MLVLALGATLVGFVLLAAALFSGVLWLAIACIIVCVVGVGLLVADVLGLGKKKTDADVPEDGDRSAESDREEDPEPGSPDEGDEDDHAGPVADDQTGSDNTETREIPRVSRHGSADDPPTEEIRLDKPR